jgi:hypothetical protein
MRRRRRRNAAGGGGKVEGSTSFCEQKEAKKLYDCGVWHKRGKCPQEQKFFASFFQKRSPCFAMISASCV